MKDIRDVDDASLEQQICGLGFEPYRAKQVYDWIHNKQIQDLDACTNIPKKLMNSLKKDFYVKNWEIIEKKQDTSCTKFLLASEETFIETVFLKQTYGNTLCISTQMGCKMNCRFCATATMGFICHLTAGEMLSQIYDVKRELGESIHHIVLMGMGEPLDNYDNVVRFIKMVNCDKGMNISKRHITLSTCGLVDRIDQLAVENLNINLSLSLHATDDETRKLLMPIAKRYSIKETLDALARYQNLTKRRVSIEYILLKGVNDHDMQAKELAALLQGLKFHVNLIPYHETNALLEPSVNMLKFQKILNEKHINCTIRQSKGKRINAACGQLYNRKRGGNL